MNPYLGDCLAAGALPMPDIIADPPAPAGCPPVSGSGIAQSRSLDPDLSGLTRGARARGHGPFRQADRLTGRDAGRWLLIGCKLAASKTKNPRICATNRENSLQIPCRFSQPSRPSQGFCGFPPAAMRGMLQEQPGAKFAPRRRCLLVDSHRPSRRIPR